MSKVPGWIVDSLGLMVELNHDFEGPCEHYAKGHRCRVISIQCGKIMPYVTVALDRNDEGYEENIPLDGIRPIRH